MFKITRQELKQRIDGGWNPILIETLQPEQYREFHLPGAINVPLDENFEQRIQESAPDRIRSVVVYCYSRECPASAEAARRMDQLGYTNVYDYEDGKTDWKEAGLPIETVHIEMPA